MREPHRPGVNIERADSHQLLVHNPGAGAIEILGLRRVHQVPSFGSPGAVPVEGRKAVVERDKHRIDVGQGPLVVGPRPVFS